MPDRDSQANLQEEVRALQRRIIVPGGRPGQVLTRQFGRPYGADWEAPSKILVATATANLTLTTSYQSIVGDGDSTKVRLLLPTPGDWLIEAVVDFAQNGAGSPGAIQGELYVNDSGTAESGRAIYQPTANPDRATVPQSWKVTTTIADTPVELKAKMETAGGNARVAATHTSLSATGGVGASEVTPTAHSALSGVTANQHHTKYLDADAIAAVPFIEYIPFGSEPITGQSYAP